MTTQPLYGTATPAGESSIENGHPCPYLLSLLRALHSLLGHRGEISSVAFNYEGTVVATASMDKTCKLWDTRTGKLIHTVR